MTAPRGVPREQKELSSVYREPQTATQRRIAQMWTEHLEVDPVGVDDDFFELGGHSLLAADLLVATEVAVGVRVPARTLYLRPTVAALAEAIDLLGAAEPRP